MDMDSLRKAHLRVKLYFFKSQVDIYPGNHGVTLTLVALLYSDIGQRVIEPTSGRCARSKGRGLGSRRSVVWLLVGRL